jgi:myosin-light-chain kinase
MVMEYISGGELFERVVEDDFKMKEREWILLMRKICEGVE